MPNQRPSLRQKQLRGTVMVMDILTLMVVITAHTLTETIGEDTVDSMADGIEKKLKMFKIFFFPKLFIEDNKLFKIY